MRYRLFDFTIESDFAFDRLTPSTDAPRLELREDAAAADTRGVSWFHALSRPDERPWLNVGRTDGELVLDFRRSVVVRYRCATVRWERDDSVGDASFQHLMLDQALPLIAAYAGAAILHAACVTGEDGAILLAGPAGVGKSTLAAAIARCHGGHLGDDAAALTLQRDRLLVQPAYAAVRLWPDTASALGYAGGVPVWEDSDKHAFQESPSSIPSSTLKAIYVLERAAGGVRVDVRDMLGRDALMALVRHAYVLDPGDRQRLAALFSTLASVASRVRIRRLMLPHDYCALPPAVSRVAADLYAGCDS